jgi:propanol-preferring alcohol dehydrogenase
MRAMLLPGPRQPLLLTDLPRPVARAGQVVVAIEACAVCRTDLHLQDGELENIGYPLIPGHQIVGRISSGGARLPIGTRVGVPWLGGTCGTCMHCLAGRENLCDAAEFVGYTMPGGYAEFVAVDERYCFPLSEEAPAEAMAPWLCAGLIGYRSLRMCGDAQSVGLYGFGAAANLLAQVLRYQQRRCYAFTRPGDRTAQAAADRLGASWVGSSDERPAEELDAAIIFAPVGALVPAALRSVRKGGIVVCGGIHMSDIPSFPYALLWGERAVRSVANLTRADGREFLSLAAQIPLVSEVHTFALEEANDALAALRAGAITGSAVLAIDLPATSSA